MQLSFYWDNNTLSFIASMYNGSMSSVGGVIFECSGWEQYFYLIISSMIWLSRRRSSANCFITMI